MVNVSTEAVFVNLALLVKHVLYVHATRLVPRTPAVLARIVFVSMTSMGRNACFDDVRRTVQATAVAQQWVAAFVRTSGLDRHARTRLAHLPVVCMAGVCLLCAYVILVIQGPIARLRLVQVTATMTNIRVTVSLVCANVILVLVEMIAAKNSPSQTATHAANLATSDAVPAQNVRKKSKRILWEMNPCL